MGIDVLLTHSYHLAYDRKQVRKQQPYPPLGTLYAASILREAAFSVAVFDTMLRDPAEFRDALKHHRPKIVAIYEDDFNFLTKMCLTRMRELAWQLAMQSQAFGARVIVHGSDAADHATEFLENGADCVLTGPGERSLVPAVRAIFGRSDLNSIEGVISRGVARDESAPSRIKSHAIPKALPLPARDLIDLEPYRQAWMEAHSKFSLNMIASRGCPFRCNWCAKPLFGDNFYVRDAADVADEMKLLKTRYGADHIWFADDIFGLNRNWMFDLASQVERKRCAVPFKVQTRADLMTRETVSALRRSGCSEVWMGVESGSQKILDAMDKGLRIEEVRSATHNLKREGIRACYFLQFGYPGEGWTDIKKTVALVRETRPDDVGISFSYPLPNTRFYERVQHQLGAKRNWSDSDDLCVMFKGAYTDEFYRRIRDTLRAEVDTWKTSDLSKCESQAAIHRIYDLWREIERLEPANRNPDATQLAPAVAHRSETHVDVRHTPEGFVSVRGFLASVRGL